jgi:(p)ppGpp synthase/HD superfamily hydrolase
MELVSEAIAFAVKAHDGMRRKKSDAPYILHPMEAAVIVGTMTDDQNLIAAAALHDVVEDAGVTIEEIEEKFGKRVRELVAADMSVANIKNELGKLLPSGSKERTAMLREYSRMMDILGEPGASVRAAQKIVALLKNTD